MPLAALNNGQKFASSPISSNTYFQMNSHFIGERTCIQIEMRMQNGAVPGVVVDISYWSAAAAGKM